MKDRAFVPAVLLLWFWVLLSSGESRVLQSDDKGNELKSYISWEDLRVVEDVGTEKSFSVKASDNLVNKENNLAPVNNESRVIVVDKRGRGDSVTVQGAVDMVPDSNSQRVKILILPGVYREKVVVPRTKPYISFIGNESYAEYTVITWSDKSSDPYSNGTELGTYRTATDCDIRSTAKRFGAIAAHHRSEESDDTGFSFVNCDIGGTGKVYLGRAWGNYSRTVYSNCYIADIITPLGWSDWDDTDRQSKVLFGEYNCRGRGAERRGRVPWSKSLTQDEVKPFLGTEFIYGDQWLRL
ncbi:hypothetical protein Bca4012_011025 [Brassica carinata]